MKIAVYGIALNEEAHVERFCRAAADADLILVADTGSTDGTVEALEAHGVEVRHIRISPWRFDDARNAVLALLPGNVDVCVALDLDEMLQPGWRQELERVWREGATRLRYTYDWGSGRVFRNEKIHARHGYRWRHPCHEVAVPDRIDEVWAETDMLLVVHEPDLSKPRSQYLDLLRLSIEEDPNEPRNAFYYARELSFAKKWDEAIRQSHRYLNLPGADWDAERSYAMRIIADGHEAIGDHGGALHWRRRAVAEAPDHRDPWVALARSCFHAGRWGECYSAATSALAIQERRLVYTEDPACWGEVPHDLAALSAYHLGMKEEALAHGRAAVEHAPDDPRLRANLAHYGEPQNLRPELAGQVASD